MMNFRNLLLACSLIGAVTGTALPAAAQVYGGIYVQVGPPAPIYETVPVSPGPAYYWVPGYWTWNGYRYVWTHGRYAYRPYPAQSGIPATGRRIPVAGIGGLVTGRSVLVTG